ncbi:MAG: hypothetical protein AAF404_19770 [Pseudomonadota bacterium]
MKWKAQSYSEAGEILKMLARQGEPLLKKLDEGADFDLLSKSARNDEPVQPPAQKPDKRSAVAS